MGVHGLLTFAGLRLKQYNNFVCGVNVVNVRLLCGDMYTECLFDIRRGDVVCGRTAGSGERGGTFTCKTESETHKHHKNSIHAILFTYFRNTNLIADVLATWVTLQVSVTHVKHRPRPY